MLSHKSLVCCADTVRTGAIVSTHLKLVRQVFNTRTTFPPQPAYALSDSLWWSLWWIDVRSFTI